MIKRQIEVPPCNLINLDSKDGIEEVTKLVTDGIIKFKIDEIVWKGKEVNNQRRNKVLLQCPDDYLFTWSGQKEIEMEVLLCFDSQTELDSPMRSLGKAVGLYA